MSKKIAIFGFMKNNLGDDLFIQTLCMRYPTTQFYLATLDYPNKTLQAIENLHFSKKLKKANESMKRQDCPSSAKRYLMHFDAAVLIAGSIFVQPKNEWGGHVVENMNRLAFTKKFFIVGANFGPYQDPLFLAKYRACFRQAYDVCFRDSDSFAYFPNVKTVRWAPDVLFTHTPNKQTAEKQEVFISLIDSGFSWRPKALKSCKQAYENKLVELCAEFYHRGYSINLASFCAFQRDNEAAKRVLDQCKRRGISNVRVSEYTGDISFILNEIANAKYVIATRFHSMILGWLYRKPTYPIIYNKKLKTVIRDLDFHGKYCDITEFGSVDVAEVVQAMEEYQALDCKKTVEAAQKQFAALDQFIFSE